MSRLGRVAAQGALVLAALPWFPGHLGAQRPTVSRPLALAQARDTAWTVWLFARPGVPIDSAAARAARTGARIRVRSRWLRAVSAEVDRTTLARLARDADWRRIQPLGRFRARAGTPRAGFPFGPTAAAFDTCPAGVDPVFGASAWPLRMLNLRPLADRGVDGAGVRIALFDTGFDTQDPAFAGVTITGQRDFVFGDSVVRDQTNDLPGAMSHGTGTWSLLAAEVPARLRGVARGASYLLAKTEDIRTETRVEEDFYVAALEWADSIGVDVVSTSLGYLTFDNGFGYTPSQLNGDVAVTTVAVDSAAARGILVVTAAGNAGPSYRTLVTPADADSGLAIGAEDSTGTLALFSSRGPTGDGRLKPDLTAPGVDVCVLAGAGSVRRANGTSFATPLVAGAAALVKQLHAGLGPADLAGALRLHAANRAAPDSARGWGRPDGAASAVFPIAVQPLAPLTGPAASVTPDFSWTVGAPPVFALPVTFRLRVARTVGLSAPLLDTTLTGATVSPARAFQPGDLYWQVDAVAATGETASTGVVGPVGIPAWARLVTFDSPAGTTTLDSQPTFVWRPAAVSSPPGPFSYDLFVQRSGATLAEQGITGIPDTTFQLPAPLERSVTYTWRLVVHAGPDSSVIPSAGSFLVLDPSVPPATLLYQNFPNPFPALTQSVTCVWFDLAQATLVELEILDLRGRRVRTLLPSGGLGGVLPPGRYGRGAVGGPPCDPRFSWDGRSDDGREVPPGVYLCRLRAGGSVQFKRIVYRGH